MTLAPITFNVIIEDLRAERKGRYRRVPIEASTREQAIERTKVLMLRNRNMLTGVDFRIIDVR